METRKIIFYGTIVVTLILIAFNLKLNSLHTQLQNACTADYSSYVKNNSCPCFSSRTSLNQVFSGLPNVNVSIYQQTNVQNNDNVNPS